MSAESYASDFDLVTVQSGARSLRARDCGETFHPVVGPMEEALALHVRGQRLVERARKMGGPMVIWDVGLGAAGNAVAALDALSAAGLPVEMHSFDATVAPLEFARCHAGALGYLTPWLPAVAALIGEGVWHDGGRGVRWQLHTGDFRITGPRAPRPHAIFYDPYSARTNPELWTLEVFQALRGWLEQGPPCLLTNYTRSTAARVTLLLAGFFVGIGEGVGEKDQTTAAATDRALLSEPLGRDWLERVRRSVASAPLRAGKSRAGRIGAEDMDRLWAHPQFSS